MAPSDRIPTRPRPPPSRRRKARRLRRSSLLAGALLLLVPLLLLVSLSFLPFPSLRMAKFPAFQIFAVVEGKEIVATREWQLLGENDTIPAGLHVRMDLSTGEKWVKIAGDDDGDEAIRASAHDGSGKVEGVEVDASGALSVVETSGEEAADRDATRDGGGSSGSNSNSDSSNEEAPIQRDYEMMHRVMSQLPPEELDRFGGLPALPSAVNDTENAPSGAPALSGLTAKQRELFEARMEEIWNLRQEELARVQEENVADLPSILKERIRTLREYLSDPVAGRERVEERAREGIPDNDEDEDDEDAPAIATDVVAALRDLEYHLADVDMARDFHTLGGWPHLVALLDERMHDVDDGGGERRATVDEVRALAAQCVGTAAGNLGEFRGWALEDAAPAMNEALIARARGTGHQIAAIDGGASALSLLVKSFEDELSDRSERMRGGSMAVPPGGGGGGSDAAKRNARATYRLRATYALGALVRGNPDAQRSFVAGRGAETLARHALGTLSHVRGPSAVEDRGLARSDHKFASRVLALGEDVVVGVVLHGEDYTVVDGDGLTANQLVGAFTTERWCDLALRMLAPPLDSIGASVGRGIQERALGAVRALAPGCQRAEGEGGEPSWGTEEVKRVRSEWNREGSDDGLDPVYRRELLDLADGVLELLR